MLFDSPIYFVFLIPVVLIYWRLGRREQNIFFAVRELLLLRLVGLALPRPHDLQHAGRFSDRAANHSGAGKRQPPKWFIFR